MGLHTGSNLMAPTELFSPSAPRSVCQNMSLVFTQMRVYLSLCMSICPSVLLAGWLSGFLLALCVEGYRLFHAQVITACAGQYN